MKQYYTLVQVFLPEQRRLAKYLNEQGITYEIGADFPEELEKFGYRNPGLDHGMLVLKHIVLIDEHELTAIKLSIPGVDVIQNRPALKIQNKIRSWFSWILD